MDIVNSKPTDEKATEDKSEVLDELTLDIEDTELVALINKRLETARPFYEELEKVGAENENYWLGRQIDKKKLRDYKSKVVENVTFQTVETIIPIITSKPPEPVVQSASNTPESVAQAKNIQRILLHMFEKEKMKGKFQMVARHNCLRRLGILKYKYDPDTDNIVTDYVLPQNVVVDRHGDFVAEYLEDSIADLLQKFPEKVDEIIREFGLKAEPNQDGSYDLTTLSPQSLATKIKYIEFWTDEYVVWKYKTTIFKKLKNPNFNYKGEEAEQIDENGQPIAPEIYNYNYFDTPKKPYLFFSVFNLGKQVADDTSLVEQIMPLQDVINKRQRQIDDNFSDNGVLMGSGDMITKEELAKYTGNPEDKLWVEHGNPADGINRLPPKQLAPFAYESLIGLKSSVDNVAGTHSTTRGERQGKETLGGRQILREADFGRIDLIVRSLEELADELYKAWIHMMKVYYTQPHYARILGKDGAQQVIEYSRNSIEEGIEISVKEGSTLPIDKVSQRQEALDLLQMQGIDPISLFEKLEWPNPQESARRLFLWKNDPLSLFPDLKEEMAQNEKPPENEKKNYSITVKLETLPPAIQEEILKNNFGVQAQYEDTKVVAQQEIERINSGENVPPYEKADQAHLAVHDAFIKGPAFESLDPTIQALHQNHVDQEAAQGQKSPEIPTNGNVPNAIPSMS